MPSGAAVVAWSTIIARPVRTTESTLAEPVMITPDFLASARLPRADFVNSLSTKQPKSAGTETSVFNARDSSLRLTASSMMLRSALIQHPRPGKLRLISGTTLPSGAATNRIRSTAGPLSRVTIQVLSFLSGFNQNSTSLENSASGEELFSTFLIWMQGQGALHHECTRQPRINHIRLLVLSAVTNLYQIG